MKERQRWQPEEDALLRAYVKQYGAKEWNLISQRMGKTLDRDPKSCLERWKNYLKPGIKKGSLTPEEQSLVISLQSKYGNKWKKIAAEVPGRTAKRLGKWWEVFKEKQLKQLQKSQGRQDYADPAAVSAVSCSGSPEKAVQGKYDHILETFAEKYVQPKLFAFQSLPLPQTIMPNLTLPVPEPPPVLSLGSVAITDPINVSTTIPASTLPPWMSMTPTATSSLSSSSSTPSPSVSLTLSPSEPPAVLDPVQPEIGLPTRFFPVHQMGTLVQYSKELEEGRQNWVQHKKEATWRLNRLEQQLESEKARKRREKMEEIDAKIRCLREEEMAYLGRIESEYRDQLTALQRDAEAKEAKLMEAWCSKHVKLAKLVEQIGVHTSHGFTTLPCKDLR
ncbi:OLC1v1010781C1 [Oldenlandia corymbosa var. corymbosa]|uniref:OLC1v1010781C1 n=1 Tax=Oldenlandia corymbosa var. corymbosa TaxID=529605 RepID=A0AAV1DS83_OLDCO|nr:OLC1v1010781C1 [Oldenlandia corymbosa var. corymbosa]